MPIREHLGRPKACASSFFVHPNLDAAAGWCTLHSCSWVYRKLLLLVLIRHHVLLCSLVFTNVTKSAHLLKNVGTQSRSNRGKRRCAGTFGSAPLNLVYIRIISFYLKAEQKRATTVVSTIKIPGSSLSGARSPKMTPIPDKKGVSAIPFSVSDLDKSFRENGEVPHVNERSALEIKSLEVIIGRTNMIQTGENI